MYISVEERIPLTKVATTPLWWILTAWFLEEITFEAVENYVESLSKKDLNYISVDNSDNVYQLSFPSLLIKSLETMNYINFSIEHEIEMLDLLQKYGINLNQPGFICSPLLYVINLKENIPNDCIKIFKYFLDQGVELKNLYDNYETHYDNVAVYFLKQFNYKLINYNMLVFLMKTLAKTRPSEFYINKESFMGSTYLERLMSEEESKDVTTMSLYALYKGLMDYNYHRWSLFERKLVDLGVLHPHDIQSPGGLKDGSGR